MVLRLIRARTDPWKPGTWRPGTFRPWDTYLFTGVLVALAGVRGLDYLTPGDAPFADSLTVVEAAAPLWAWGALFVFGSMILGCAATWRVHAGVWVGHWILALAYATLGTGLMMDFVASPWLDGIRSATIFILPTVMHTTLAIRTGRRPLEWGLDSESSSR